jgi:hypothetical protein
MEADLEASGLSDALDETDAQEGEIPENISPMNIFVATGLDPITEQGEIVQAPDTVQGQINTEQTELPEEEKIDESEVNINEFDVQELYNDAINGLDEYDFDGIDCCADTTQLDGLLENFHEESWLDMDAEDRKEAIGSLADYVKDTIGSENPPQIEYFNEGANGSYGAYNPSSNILYINEGMLDDPREAVGTIAHELWHTYQNECAKDPHSEKDFRYQIGLSPDVYISANDDFDGYRTQLVEAEAFAFEEQIKNELEQIQGRR